MSSRVTNPEWALVTCLLLRLLPPLLRLAATGMRCPSRPTTVFGTVTDVMLAEIILECFYPDDTPSNPSGRPAYQVRAAIERS